MMFYRLCFYRFVGSRKARTTLWTRKAETAIGEIEKELLRGGNHRIELTMFGAEAAKRLGFSENPVPPIILGFVKPKR